MAVSKTYLDIPGTFVFDAEHSRLGYPLNMFCMSLSKEENRSAFTEDCKSYMNRFEMTEAQKQSIRDRNWNMMLEQGGNIYYMLKLAGADGTPYEQVYAAMSGDEPSDYRSMMIGGWRLPEGNLYKSDWAKK